MKKLAAFVGSAANVDRVYSKATLETLQERYDFIAEGKTLTKEELFTLTENQQEWAAVKDKLVEEAGAEVQGGSMYPLVVNSEAARLTEERVYDLYGLLKGPEFP